MKNSLAVIEQMVAGRNCYKTALAMYRKRELSKEDGPFAVAQLFVEYAGAPVGEGDAPSLVGEYGV